MSFNFVIAGCMDDLGRVAPARLLSGNPVHVTLNGDLHYSDMGTSRIMRGTRWDPDIFWRDGDANPPVNARTLQRLIDRYELWCGDNGMPEYREFWAKARALGIPVKATFDDHDFGVDNSDHSLLGLQNTFPLSYVGANTGVGDAPFGQTIAPSSFTQADVLQVWRARQAAVAWWKGKYGANPASPGINGDIPPSMVGLATAADYPIHYFYQDHGPGGEDGGNTVRVIWPDCVSYKAAKTATENSAKTFLGAVQTAWLKATMLDAKARGFGMVILVLSKDVAGADNLDGMGNYTWWRDNEFLPYIQANDIPAVCITGDKHLAHVSQYSTAAGDLTDLLIHCACPFGSRHSALAHHKQLVWSAPHADRPVYERVTVDASARTVTLTMLDGYDDTVLVEDVLPFGSRIPISSTRRAFTPPLSRGGYDRFTITVPASTVAWQNTTGRPISVTVVGGTVSDIAISRDGTTYDALGVLRQFTLQPGEYFKPTYSSAPTAFGYPHLLSDER